MKIDQMTPEFLQELKAQHGEDLHLVSAEGLDDLIIIRPPTRHEYKRFMDLGAKKKEEQALQTLISSCLVYPDKEAWLSMTERRPGLDATAGNVIINVAGVYQNAEAKKL